MTKFIISFLVIFCISCATYSNKESIIYDNNTMYEFRNNSSKPLIIIIDGSGFHSALGLKVGKKWYNLGIGYYLLRALKNEYTIAVPEKLNVKIGMDYYNDPEFRAIYTAENLIKSYSETINQYLSNNNYEKILLIGASEGACLLPLIYQNIIEKDKIKGMVSCGYGGLSRYEQVHILKTSTLEMPPVWRELYLKIEEFNKEIQLEPNSIDKTYWGYPYKWHSDFMHLRPFDYYKEINIPILFMHGTKDVNSAVESTRYIQENLPDKPFEYIYYENMEHGPKTIDEGLVLINDGKKWVKTILSN